MATSTITAAVTLSGPGMTSQTLNVARTISMVIGNPTVESGAISVTTSWAKVEDGPTGGGYVYIRNTEPTTAATVEIRYGTQSLGVLRPGEWAFLPIPAAASFEVKGSLATTAEYGVWTKA
tara:strand:+ start:191 stop:553 length:363 start_codon:yes stop_codon:yes gene_type:complete